MGLDMYLSHKQYFSAYAKKPDRVTVNGEELANVSEITTREAYWRKANHIHKWFVDHVQEGKDECQESEVSKEQLEELLAACEVVKADPSKGPQILPVQSGFFFGSTAYDEYYMQDIKETIKQLKAALAKERDGWFVYQASW